MVGSREFPVLTYKQRSKGAYAYDLVDDGGSVITRSPQDLTQQQDDDAFMMVETRVEQLLREMTNSLNRLDQFVGIL
jgi:hypothetical protein